MPQMVEMVLRCRNFKEIQAPHNCGSSQGR
ncbi:hypothetical protein O987_12970 [Comamonas testosteroni TK102]|uniref:Uncharacterized protein n=1 Tax=Comamonas testosteroni TK102 TaxID=1392005 RepID=A0A076PPV2_COMTE|nr:hypothetical protein O987_12970 [Comamonas testosteroni TK102]